MSSPVSALRILPAEIDSGAAAESPATGGGFADTLKERDR